MLTLTETVFMMAREVYGELKISEIASKLNIPHNEIIQWIETGKPNEELLVDFYNIYRVHREKLVLADTSEPSFHDSPIDRLFSANKPFRDGDALYFDMQAYYFMLLTKQNRITSGGVVYEMQKREVKCIIEKLTLSGSFEEFFWKTLLFGFRTDSMPNTLEYVFNFLHGNLEYMKKNRSSRDAVTWAILERIQEHLVANEDTIAKDKLGLKNLSISRFIPGVLEEDAEYTIENITRIIGELEDWLYSSLDENSI